MSRHWQFLRHFELCMSQSREEDPEEAPETFPVDSGEPTDETVWYSYSLPRIRESESRVGYLLQQILHTEDTLWLLWHDPRVATEREHNLATRAVARDYCRSPRGVRYEDETARGRVAGQYACGDTCSTLARHGTVSVFLGGGRRRGGGG